MAKATSLPVQTSVTQQSKQASLGKRSPHAASVGCSPETRRLSQGLCTGALSSIWAPKQQGHLFWLLLCVNRAGSPCGLRTARPCSPSSPRKHITKNLCNCPAESPSPEEGSLHPGGGEGRGTCWRVARGGGRGTVPSNSPYCMMWGHPRCCV